jgi:uncharacterized membrane protein (DUF2068 family)
MKTLAIVSAACAVCNAIMAPLNWHVGNHGISMFSVFTLCLNLFVVAMYFKIRTKRNP